MDASALQANFAAVEQRIASACRRARRPRQSVTLVAVSKLHPPELIRMAWSLGQLDFGENYAQELRDKHQALLDCLGLRWHAIGPLQPKNAKYVAKAAAVFHALERMDVAAELSRRRQGAPLHCLVEVNVSSEQSKAGLSVDELPAFLAQARSLPGIEIVGLTTMPPQRETAEPSRPHFRVLRELALRHNLPQLSMGSTGDFEVAIEEGATLVRVGTALFGQREHQGSLKSP